MEGVTEIECSRLGDNVTSQAAVFDRRQSFRRAARKAQASRALSPAHRKASGALALQLDCRLVE
jgi:hypothetical protein